MNSTGWLMTLFADPLNIESLGNALFLAIAFGLLGIALLALGFKVFEWITPKLHVEEELSKGNTAVAIVVGAVILGVTVIVVRAMSG